MLAASSTYASRVDAHDADDADDDGGGKGDATAAAAAAAAMRERLVATRDMRRQQGLSRSHHSTSRILNIAPPPAAASSSPIVHEKQSCRSASALSVCRCAFLACSCRLCLTTRFTELSSSSSASPMASAQPPTSSLNGGRSPRTAQRPRSTHMRCTFACARCRLCRARTRSLLRIVNYAHATTRPLDGPACLLQPQPRQLSSSSLLAAC